jgi:4-amino-4-deoxy-L-arabinose transferase-like glycosyltransferase
LPSSQSRLYAQLLENRLLCALLAGLVLLGLAFRLYAVSSTGIGGNDTILYYSLAEHWLQGEFSFQIAHGAHVFRPVFLAFNALALLVFGSTGHAINLANIFLDGGSMVLLAALGWTISRQWSVVLASVLVFACLPIAIWSSRQELPHTLSTFLVLLAVLVYVRALLVSAGRSQYVKLAMSGLFLGAAVMTHEELALLAIPMGIFLLFHRTSDTGNRLKESSGCLAAFLGVPLVTAIGVYVLEAETVERAVGKLFSFESGSNVFLPEVASRYLWNVMTGTTSAAFAILCGFSVLCIALAFLFRRSGRSQDNLYWAGFLFSVPIVFVAIYTPMFNTIFSRGFLPLVPLMVLGVCLVLSWITARLSKASTAAIIFPILALIVISNLASYSAFAVGNRRYAKSWAEPIWSSRANIEKGLQEFKVDARYVQSYATHWHYIYTALKGKIRPSERLLVLPITTMYSPGRRALQTQAYFGDDAIFRVDFPGKSIAEIVREKNVRWVLFTTGQQRKVPRNIALYQYNGEWSERRRIDLARDYGLARYSVRQEYGQLAKFLQEANAEPRMPFQNGSFEQRVARVWYLPEGWDGQR